ncbi:hypothetical protein AVEN_268696-1 [Araneus ventricosus]|uniref:Tc1-like transposase DDE domain-containing protein n=1 Tax=Araneus ventricosus TaxID=182803 RepID=A0A4Y1ZMZ9_ARAVE|nr:hypothetical protein AVEN_268696-1 [Araneus ventricosus]
MTWREPGTRYRVPKRLLHRWRVSYLGRVATNSQTDLYVFAGGSVTAVRYRDEFLHFLVRPFIAAMGTNVIFMEDYGRAHRARLVRSYLESDLNPIEHVWDMLGRRIASGNVHPPGALTSLTTGMGITATRSNQRHYLSACLAVVKHAFQLEGIIPII